MTERGFESRRPAGLILEIALPVFMLGCCGYWCGSERYWNWFDLFLMGAGLSDIAIQLADDESSGVPGTSLLRFCRFIRLVRIVKVLEVENSNAKSQEIILLERGGIASIPYE